MSSNENEKLDSPNNKNNNSNNKEEEEENEEEEKMKEISDVNLPIINQLYPPVKEIDFFDENNNNNKILRLIKEKPIIKKDILTMEDYEKQKLELTDKFLKDLIKDPCPLPKTNIIDVISYFIRNSTLITKLESSYKWKNEEELTSLCNLISKNLSFEKFDKGDILFKIGETGNKFYFILQGYISILKLKEISKVKMSYNQYFNLCIKLLKNKEYHILEETLKKNSSTIPINDIQQLQKIYIILFRKKLYENIENNYIFNNNTLTSFFNTNEESLEKYDINLRELQPFEDLDKMKDWKAYLIRRIKPSKDELDYFEKYKEYIIRKIEPVNINYYIYDDFLYLGAGYYFGENSLEKGNIYTGGKRNATIRAETELICGSMKGIDYLSIIEPKKRLEKLKEIRFIFNNFFFKEISIFLFEKNYFHLFSFCEYKKDDVIISTGSPLKDLIFIRDGEVSIEMTSSVLNIQNLIKSLFEYIFSNELFAQLPQNKQNKLLNNKRIETIKNYINEPIFKKLRGFSIKFNEELNKKRNFKIATLEKNDILGLEEIYLKISYITKVTVFSKRLNCYQISEEHFDQIINTEKDITMAYLKASINKIVTMIQRLQNIKQHYINYFIQKYEKNIDEEEKKDLISNNNILNENIVNNNISYVLKNQDSEINIKGKEVDNNNEYISGNNSVTKYDIENRNNNSIIRKKKKNSPIKISVQINHNNSKNNLLIKTKNNNNSNKNSHINIKISDNNKVRPRNNFDYNNGVDLDKIKRKKISKTAAKMKFFNLDKKTKKNLIIGDKNISISKLKSRFNEIQLLSQENTDLIQIIQSTKYNTEISKNEKSKDEPRKEHFLKGSSNYLKYRLSYVPLYNIKKRQTKHNTNLFNTETITSNFTPFQLTIFSSSSNNNQSESKNNNVANNTNYDSSSNNNQIISKETGNDKSQQNQFFNSYNYNSRNIPKIFNLKSHEKIRGHINEKIKEFYKELKSKGLSYIPNGEKNTFYTRKFNQKYKSASKYKNIIYTNNYSQTELNKSKKFLPVIRQLIKSLI